MIKDTILDALSKSTGIKKEEILLEFPENEAFGDFTSNVAIKLPRQVHLELVKKLEGNKELSKVIDKIEVAGPGFINFWLKKEVLLQNIVEIEKEKEKYGESEVGKGRTVVIDYSSPNIAKPFGIGHLRSTIIGQALYNLYKALGYKVIGDNHLGDWGTQFGTLLYQITSQHLTVDKLTNEKLEELYVDFHKKAEDNPELEDEARKWFKKLEEGNTEAKAIWQKCVDVSLKEFDRVYKMLGVKIDYALGESFYEAEMRQVQKEKTVRDRLTRGENNAWVIDLSKAGIKIPLMFLKSDGATTYATRDLATIKYRMRKWKPDIIIYEVGAEQTLHFQQVFAAARLLGFTDSTTQLVHTAHGLYLAPDGKKFSTRKGKTIKLEEVLNEAIERAKKLGNDTQEVAKEVGIGAIKYFDLMHSVSSNVVFDWEKMMNLEGNSGPYLQYTVARTNSVLSKADLKGLFQGRGLSRKGESFKGVIKSLSKEETIVLRDLIKFSEIVENAAKTYSPNLLANYLFDLAQKYNGFYNKHWILQKLNMSKNSVDYIKPETQEFRLSLTFATNQVLKNGLKLLGIETPERM